jgi:hypothetical protein
VVVARQDLVMDLHASRELVAADCAESRWLSQKRACSDVTDPPRYVTASHRDAQILDQPVEPILMTST